MWAPIPVLMPGERSSTEWEPGKRLWAQLPALNREPGILDVSMLVGYVWADEPRSTAAVVVTGTAPDTAAQDRHQPRTAVLGRAHANSSSALKPARWTSASNVRWTPRSQPAILADSGDNPTGGGNGDQATVLESLLRHKAQHVVFAGIADRPATEACYKAGVGARIPLSIGATLDPKASQPVKTEAVVKSLLPETNPARREAVVQIQGITLVVSAYRRPYHDIKDFTRFGLDPKSFKIIVVKSGYLSPELAPIANPSLMALSDGAINQDIVHLPANRYRRPSYPFVANLEFHAEGLRVCAESTLTAFCNGPRGERHVRKYFGDVRIVMAVAIPRPADAGIEHLAVFADLLKAAAIDTPDITVVRRQGAPVAQ